MPTDRDGTDVATLLAVAIARYDTLTHEERWGVAVLADRLAQGLLRAGDRDWLVRLVG